MAKGSPSLIALLGLLAVAGYQNRDKLADVLGNRGTSNPDRFRDGSVRDGGLVDDIRNLFGGSGRGNMIGGLSELFDRFANPVQRAKVDTWVQRGPNAPLAPADLEDFLDEDTIAELVAKTGLSREELLHRLSSTLPDAVDQVTPEGQFPPVSAPEPRTT